MSTISVPSAPAATAPDAAKKRIVVADELGYCWGVRRALDIITEAAESEGPIAPVGDIIHNPQVVERLRAKGVEGAESVEQAKSRGFTRVAITARGRGAHLPLEGSGQAL